MDLKVSETLYSSPAFQLGEAQNRLLDPPLTFHLGEAQNRLTSHGSAGRDRASSVTTITSRSPWSSGAMSETLWVVALLMMISTEQLRRDRWRPTYGSGSRRVQGRDGARRRRMRPSLPAIRHGYALRSFLCVEKLSSPVTQQLMRARPPPQYDSQTPPTALP